MMTTQQEDVGRLLQEAVLQAAVPTDYLHIPTLADADLSGGKNIDKTRVGDGTAGPGRPRNVKNRLTNLREAVLEAFDQVGGAQYLAKLAEGTSSDRAAFVGLVAKVLPTQINANVEGGISVQLSWLGSRSIGTTVAQPVEQVTQVIDLERDNGGKYRIKDPVGTPDDALPAPAGDQVPGSDQGQDAQKGHEGLGDA